MASTSKALPASSQKSTSTLSESPGSNYEALAEITVSINAPSNPHNPHSPNEDNDDKMARTRGALNRKTTNQRERSKRQPRAKKDSPISDEFAETEIKVSPSASKGRTAAKRSQLAMPAKTNASAPPAAKKARVASRSKKWEPDNVTQNPRSPLVDADLRVGFLTPHVEMLLRLLTRTYRPCFSSPPPGTASHPRTNRRSSRCSLTRLTSWTRAPLTHVPTWSP